MSSEFSPVDVTRMGQLEHLLQNEQKVRVTREQSGSVDSLYRFDNPDWRTHHFDEPPSHEVVFDKAMLRGMRKVKQALHDDIVYEMRKNYKDNRYVRRIQPDKKQIVDGLIQAYDADGIR